jgi:hypothetical protein
MQFCSRRTIKRLLRLISRRLGRRCRCRSTQTNVYKFFNERLSDTVWVDGGPRASVCRKGAQGILQPALGWSGAIVLLPSDIASAQAATLGGDAMRASLSRSDPHGCCFAKTENAAVCVRAAPPRQKIEPTVLGLMILLFCGDCCKCVIPHLFGVLTDSCLHCCAAFIVRRC